MSDLYISSSILLSSQDEIHSLNISSSNQLFHKDRLLAIPKAILHTLPVDGRLGIYKKQRGRPFGSPSPCLICREEKALPTMSLAGTLHSTRLGHPATILQTMQRWCSATGFSCCTQEYGDPGLSQAP